MGVDLPASLEIAIPSMPLQSRLTNHGEGLCLLSLDSGGARSISQLKILAEIMHRLNFEAPEGEELFPCDVFDMIGGSGTGGFIAILLVVFGLSAEKALEEFIEFTVGILEKTGMEAPARTAALQVYIDRLLVKYEFAKEARFLDLNIRSKGSKIAIPILYKNHIEHALILRNYGRSEGDALNFTISDAILATLASPTLFTPTSVTRNNSTLEYISGDLKHSNPTRTIVSEAYDAFGKEARVACLLSIGSGHSGILSVPERSDLEKWNEFLEKAVMDSQQTAEEIESQMGHLGLYHRFSVSRGLEEEVLMNTSDASAHTAVYLSGVAVLRKLDLCSESLRLREGVASLDQLKRSGSQTVLPPALPPPTKSFVMRKAPWEFIEKVMLGPGDSSESPGPRMLVMTGMGGCGKTQLMLKFTQTHKDKFAAAFFIDGSSAARIRADTIRHVRSLGVAHSQMGFDDCLLFLARPSPSGSRLILYDNVDDPDINLAPLLPLGESCAIVITSRNRSLGGLCPESHLELDVMSMDEAVNLLLHRSGHSPEITDSARKEAGEVAQALGFLPIALTQARSYMFHTQCSAGEYLERLCSSRDKLLAQPVKHQRDMRYASTYAAFEASFALLTLRCQHLLRLLSYFHWSNFPFEVVILAAKYNFSDYHRAYIKHGEEYYIGRAMLKEVFLHEGKWEITELDGMMVSLRNHSLITLEPGIGTQLVQMHPVTHGWVKSCIPKQEEIEYQSGAILLLALGSRNEYTPSTQYLTGHITHLFSLWDQLDINNAEAFADILHAGGSVEGALQLRERVVRELRSRIEPESTKLIDSLWLLSISYSGMGRYQDAEPLQREVLKLKMETLGERHPDTITASSNLASIYSGLGRLKETEELREKVLKLRKEILGERHPDTIAASNNLAITYINLGRLKEAEEVQEEVLKLRKEILGERHPATITASNNLADTYRRLGRLKEAEELQEEVLKLRKEILGERHSDTITASSNLAATYSQQGRLKEAEELQEEVLKLMKEILGERHPDTIAASSNLANTYSDLGRLKEAEELREEVLKLSKEILGERHPDTIKASNNLANTYHSLGRLKEAEELRKEVLKLRKEILGERHPDTIAASSNLANTYSDLGRLKEAEELREEVLKLSKEILGERHPDTIKASNNLASTYSDLGRLKEAEELQEEVLKLRKEILGQRHPDTINAMNNLTCTYRDLGRLEEAEALQLETLRRAEEVLGKDHPITIFAMLNMALIYGLLGRKVEALKLLDVVEPIIDVKLGKHHSQYTWCRNTRAHVESLADSPGRTTVTISGADDVTTEAINSSPNASIAPFTPIFPASATIPTEATVPPKRTSSRLKRRAKQGIYADSDEDGNLDGPAPKKRKGPPVNAKEKEKD